MTTIQSEISAHLEVANKMHSLEPKIQEICEIVADTLQRDNKVFFIGNGGSAADAQHIAAELCGRFRAERQSLPGLALTTDTSALTSIANDYGYEQVFVRQLSGMYRPGDLLVGISTSGNSPNVIRAVEFARRVGLKVVGLLGKDGGKLKDLCDFPLLIPSSDTARIQEMHILVGHIICQYVDESFGS